MEWLIAIAFFAGFLALLPLMLRGARKSRRKGDIGGMMLGLGLAFMAIFDPGRSASVEEVQKKKEIGDEEADESGDRPD